MQRWLKKAQSLRHQNLPPWQKRMKLLRNRFPAYPLLRLLS
jgi:hypothetical protein